MTAAQTARLWILSGKVEKGIPLTSPEWAEYMRLINK